MAYFLFIDESGHDHRNSPYEVLAGVAINDTMLWELVKEVHKIELGCFGRRYRHDGREIKATNFLNRKTFRLASQMEPIGLPERTEWAKQALDNGENANRNQLTALAQAKLSYVNQIFRLCRRYYCKVFAAITTAPARMPANASMLRKDYVYLFERFYYFLEDMPGEPRGIIVFDELDKSASHILLSQMERYFQNTAKGRARSSRIIPEPFFVHSDLTTGIQIVDFVAYLFSWSFRVAKMIKPGREELKEFVDLIKPMRYKTTREIGDNNKHLIWSVTPV